MTFVVGCQRKADAEQFLLDLKERMSQFALELHPDKTRLIEFGRFAMANRRARGERRPETFDFLGFTHYCRKSCRGYVANVHKLGGECFLRGCLTSIVPNSDQNTEESDTSCYGFSQLFRFVSASQLCRSCWSSRF